MQAGDDAAAAADTAATQNLLANIASILQSTTAAVPPGPPLNGGPLGGPPSQGGPGGSPTHNRTNSSGGSNPAGAQGMGLSPNLILLPAGLQFPLQLNGPGMQNLAPYLNLISGLGPGGTGDGSMPYVLPPLGIDGNFNLAALLGGGGLDLDGQAADLSGLDPTRKAGGVVGSKRPADGSAGAPYKRERSEEGRTRESIPNLPHLKGKCHVESCNADLTGLSSYYQRYRTCEVHLKAPSIMKDGVQQRFCQQCGRFHELSEFDGNKRSCRSRLQSHNVRRRKRTEEQMANQAAAESAQAVSNGPGGLGPPGLPPLGQLPLPQHGLLGPQPNLTELINQVTTESLLNSALAGQDPTKQPKQEDSLAALLSNLPQNLLPQNLLAGLTPPDANQAALQLALQAVTSGGEHLGPPLLDTLLKSATAATAAGPATGELPAQDLQQQLAMVLAAAPAAAASIVGEAPGPGVSDAVGLGAHVGDPHVVHHTAAHGHADPHHLKTDVSVAGQPGVQLGEGRPPEGAPQM